MDMTKVIDLIIQYGMKGITAMAVLVIGLAVIKIITSFIGKALTAKEVDTTLHPFLMGLVSNLLKIALIISILGLVGIKTTSFIAILGAASLAVGMALQGSLGNFAGGVLILIFKPFKLGHVIEAQGFIGSVSEVGIFCTVMKSPDNKTVILPNGPLAGGAIINYSTEATRRVDWVFGVSYADDLKKTQSALISILEKDSRILKEPSPFVRVGELADSSVNFTVRAWVNAADYWDVHFDTIEAVKVSFDEKGISFPFPQRDIHIVERTSLPQQV